MKSVILSTATWYIMPLMLLFSTFVMLRGHNEPGGGFVGGLVAAAAFSLTAITHGAQAARTMLVVDTRALIAAGLLMAVLSGLMPAVFFGRPFLTGLWSVENVPVVGAIGTPQAFDIGVYLTVVGVVLTLVFTLAEAAED